MSAGRDVTTSWPDRARSVVHDDDDIRFVMHVVKEVDHHG